MSSDAVRAAFRVFCSDKVKVRTVNGVAHEYNRHGGVGVPGGRSPEYTRALHELIVNLKARGYTRKQIREATGVSLQTISKHVNGKIQVKP